MSDVQEGQPPSASPPAAEPLRRGLEFHSLHSRIALYFAVLLVCVLGVVLVFVQTAVSRNAVDRIKEELQIGERVFRRQLDQNNRQLSQAAEILSRDFAFREAVATRDVATIVSALQNQGGRINAAVMMLASTEHRLIADTRRSEANGQPFAFPWLLKAAEREGRAAGMVIIEGRVYQLAVVPVLAPVPIAWAAFGFPIDDSIARDLSGLTELQVSFLSQVSGGDWKLLASTAPEDMREPLRAAVAASPAFPAATTAAQPAGIRLSVGDYESLLVPIERREDYVIVAVLQRSLDEALAAFRQLQAMLLLLAAGAIVVSVAMSVLIARTITRPVAALAELTRRVEEGDYTHAVQVTAQDEIGDLARRFNLMREGIAARQDQIVRLAYRDVLTDLPNRTLFNDRMNVTLELARRAESPMTVLLMDLDRFKYINDTLGHHAGDQALQHVARRLSALMRRADTTARLGGDEFAVLMADTDVGQATQVVHKILKALEEPISIAGQDLDVRASIGMATFPEHGQDSDTLLRHADTAMYAAKRTSSGYAVYDLQLDQQGSAQLSLLGDLRRAVDRGELRLMYQPKVNLASDRIDGVECLIRWMHPERGIIAPIDFIPFAEQTGFIRTITEWVIATATAQCGAWRDAGLTLKVAVNISAPDLLNERLPDQVAEMLAKHGVPAGLLTMEITESSVMQDPSRAIELLARLKALGISLSIDDFGTGYSSLAYLKELPVHELKIDRSFTRNVMGDRKDRAIVLSTIELGHNLGLTVVAEGVEDEQCLDLLRELGCDCVQGYFITPALEAVALMTWLAERTSRRQPLPQE